MRIALLTSLLLRKATLCHLRQMVLLLFLLLLQETTACAAFNTIWDLMLAFLLPTQCKQLLKVQPHSYLHMKLTCETQGCVFVHVSYLFFHSVILIDGILVFRSSDAEQRGQSLSHVVTHYRTHKHSIKTMMKVPKNNQIQLVWNKLWNTLGCIPVKHLIQVYCLTVKYPASVTCLSHK